MLTTFIGLTPELSRVAHVASGGVALAYTASAATKQRRLERFVRAQMPIDLCTVRNLYRHCRDPNVVRNQVAHV